MEQDCSFRSQNSNALLDYQGIHLHFTGMFAILNVDLRVDECPCTGQTWRYLEAVSSGVAYLFLEIYQHRFHNLCTSTYICIHTWAIC